MKHVITTAFAALFLLSASAQSTVQPAPAKSVQSETTDEVRQLSGQLKEAYGLVSREAAMLDREIGADASKATAEQAARKEQLKTALSQLEGMLHTVNSGDQSQWAEVKAKAETVRTNALSLVRSQEKK
ncbi:MAG: hypothetical protein H6591_01275 [Flavobacteriales bacterium]|nr:hypothetical protein [Flavobacteriales bacterium]